jgi:hypothetical protein
VPNSCRQRRIVDCHFHSPVHLLVAGEHGLRRDGDSYIERVLRSTLRDVSRKLTFIAIALEIFREGVHAIRPGSGQNDEQRQ